jgi:hypothetical protein
MTTTTLKTKRTKTPNPTSNPDGSVSVNFTCASEKDTHKVTLSLNQLRFFPNAFSVRFAHDQGLQFVVYVKTPKSREDIGIVFTVNRTDISAATNAWPLILEDFFPAVGQPQAVPVTRISYIGNGTAR